eukprot:s2957_g8.t1
MDVAEVPAVPAGSMPVLSREAAPLAPCAAVDKAAEVEIVAEGAAKATQPDAEPPVSNAKPSEPVAAIVVSDARLQQNPVRLVGPILLGTLKSCLGKDVEGFNALLGDELGSDLGGHDLGSEETQEESYREEPI